MDYIFYRIYLYYKRKDDIPVFTGILFVFVIQFSIFLFLGVMTNLLSNNVISEKFLSKNQFWLLYGGILVFFLFFNILRYGRKGKVKTILERYEGKELNDKIKTWHIFMIPVDNPD